ncbi:MAG: hypothetical protein JWQ79_3833 [Mucilaginibacter sp.]|nr:hypothetical protein [Mucilaginibacter sp.]
MIFTGYFALLFMILFIMDHDINQTATLQKIQVNENPDFDF